MTFTPEQIAVIGSGVRAREETSARRTGTRGLYRVQIEVHGPLAYRGREATEPDAVMEIGEPRERGGTGEGASPLAHFLAGVGSCLLNQFVRVAIADGLDVEFDGAAVKGEFDRHAGGGFRRITCRVDARGRLAAAAAASLLERAEALCYVHVTLRKAVRMTTTLWLDGEEVATSVTGPEPA